MNFFFSPEEIIPRKPATIGQNVVNSKWINAGFHVTDMATRPNSQNKWSNSLNIFPLITVPLCLLPGW